MLSELDIDYLILVSPAYREVYEEGYRRGREARRREVIEELLRALLVHHLRRNLTPDECSTIAARAATLAPLQDHEILHLDHNTFHAWLLNTDAE